MGATVINEQAIPAHKKYRLDGKPPYTVTAFIVPTTARATIRGVMADGSVSAVELVGPKAVHPLPFAQPKLYVEFHSGLESFRLHEGDERRSLPEL